MQVGKSREYLDLPCRTDVDAGQEKFSHLLVWHLLSLGEKRSGRPSGPSLTGSAFLVVVPCGQWFSQFLALDSKNDCDLPIENSGTK